MTDNLINLGEVLTPEAIKAAQKKQVYGFKQENGEVIYYKVIRINKAKKLIMAERTKLYTEEEMNTMPKKDAEKIIRKGSK